MRFKRVLITGSDGLLGRSITASFKNYEDVDVYSERFDLRSLTSCRDVCKNFYPDLIIHSAAKTDLEWCERNPANARKHNVLGTHNLFDSCRESLKKGVYISSTGVYGAHMDTPYIETSDVLPTTVHHKQKLEAEGIVQGLFEDSLILRTGWLFGANVGQTDFVTARIAEIRASDVVYSNVQQIGNPTFVNDLVLQIQHLLDFNAIGVFNCVGNGEAVSRFDYVEKIAKTLGAKTEIKECSSSYFGRVAPVSPNESAFNKGLDSLGANIMGNWEDRLVKYVNSFQ